MYGSVPTDRVRACRIRAKKLENPGGALLAYLEPQFDHIPVMRLWAFVSRSQTLQMSEHSHILDCEQCRAALRACIRSETLEAALRELKPSLLSVQENWRDNAHET